MFLCPVRGLLLGYTPDLNDKYKLPYLPTYSVLCNCCTSTGAFTSVYTGLFNSFCSAGNLAILHPWTMLKCITRTHIYSCLYKACTERYSGKFPKGGSDEKRGTGEVESTKVPDPPVDIATDMAAVLCSRSEVFQPGGTESFTLVLPPSQQGQLQRGTHRLEVNPEVRQWWTGRREL